MGCTASRSVGVGEAGDLSKTPALSNFGDISRSSRRVARESQFLDKEVAASWRANHTVSIRSNLIQIKSNNIEDDYTFNRSKELGRGGVGFVVVGEANKTNDYYAIKICDKSSSSQARLSREVLLLKDVDHVNIIRLFSVYDAPDYMYFVMELCTGGHLGNVIKARESGHFSEKEAKNFCRQLMSAISHVHSRGIAHRDVKLQNILLDTHDGVDPQLKLIDFGYGSRFIGALPMHSRVGTPYTLAPEVIRESYDQRCDVWSAAVVLFIMLSGKRPFEALDCVGAVTEAGKAALTTNVLGGRYSFHGPAWQTVSDEAKQFVSALFTQPYTERMEAFEALNDPWLRTDSRKMSAALAANSVSNNIVANMMNNLDVSTPSLRRTGNVALAFGLQPEDASKMQRVFQTVDTDGSGGLDVDEFETAMRILCPTLSPSDCQLIFTAIDVNGDKQISYTEFLAASLDPRCVDISELNKAFHVLDANGDGYISSLELDALYKLKLHGPPPTNPAGGRVGPEGGDTDVSIEILEMMASCDHDKDGLISYEEFIWGMTGQWAKEIIGHNAARKDLQKLAVASAASASRNASINNSISRAHSIVDIPSPSGAGGAAHDDGELKSEEIFAGTPGDGDGEGGGVGGNGVGEAGEFSGSNRKFSHTSHAILGAEPTESSAKSPHAGGDLSNASP